MDGLGLGLAYYTEVKGFIRVRIRIRVRVNLGHGSGGKIASFKVHECR